jgi:hypothetical protein
MECRVGKYTNIYVYILLVYQLCIIVSMLSSVCVHTAYHQNVQIRHKSTVSIIAEHCA